FALAPGALFVALIGTAVADLIETVLFRISLGRFLDGAGPEAVKGIAGLTRVFFALKAMGAVTALALLFVLALYAHPPDLAGNG
ncbi:MAG TPA: hypothetical protein VGR08_12505, partial [Thermomicrobiales bacterium]|nr:hypothetical protein [Thermomicrobiales bacterium]